MQSSTASARCESAVGSDDKERDLTKVDEDTFPEDFLLLIEITFKAFSATFSPNRRRKLNGDDILLLPQPPLPGLAKMVDLSSLT